MTRVRPALAVGMAAAALLALPLGAFARHPHQQVKGTQVRGQDTSPPTLTSLTAGTVTSLQDNVLTVTLNDGQVLTGQIDPRTKIVCGTPPPVRPRPALPPEPNQPPFGTSGPQGDQGHAGPPAGFPGKGPGPDIHPYIHPCGPEALTPGTLIHAVGLMAEPRGVHYMGLALIKPVA